MLTLECPVCRKTIQKKETKCSKCSTTINNSPITDNRLKKIKNPNEKCKNCGDKCNQYFLYCKPCAKKHNNLMREIKLRENKKTKTRLAPGTGTKHRTMTEEDYIRVFGK